MNDYRDQPVSTQPLPEDTDPIHRIRKWRTRQRNRLLARREELNRSDCRQSSSRVIDTMRREYPLPADARVGFFWPLKGEIDLRPLIREFLQIGVQVALPVIVAKDAPMEFWKWDARTKLCSRGLWGIPAPVERVLVSPTVLFVPLLGFDMLGHRLGHGGGYYDRTLANSHTEPLKIGIGHEFGRLSTIHPLAHDILMDAVVTDIGITWHTNKETR